MYVIMTDERHSDPYARLCKYKDRAIDIAREWAHEMCRHEDDYDESYCPDGWVFRAGISCEGGSVWVYEQEVEE